MYLTWQKKLIKDAWNAKFSFSAFCVCFSGGCKQKAIFMCFYGLLDHLLLHTDFLCYYDIFFHLKILKQVQGPKCKWVNLTKSDTFIWCIPVHFDKFPLRLPKKIPLLQVIFYTSLASVLKCWVASCFHCIQRELLSKPTGRECFELNLWHPALSWPMLLLALTFMPQALTDLRYIMNLNLLTPLSGEMPRHGFAEYHATACLSQSIVL